MISEQTVLHTDLLILQPTPFCNINCSYCYLPDRGNRGRMSTEVLEATFSRVLPSRLSCGKLTVVWHAGEPLVLPPSWYEAAFAVAERHRPSDLVLEHCFQSNGTLLNAEWIDFLRRSGARLSLSLDGPAWLHDRNRRTRSGHGTHAQAMRGLRLLQDAGMNPLVLAVLTPPALDVPDELYDFFRDEGIADLAFNVEEQEGANSTSAMYGELVENAYRRFLTRFIARMHAEPGVLSLRELRNALGVVRAGAVSPETNQEAVPMRIVSVAANGLVSTFSPELLGMTDRRYDDFIFGNILYDSLETIIDRVFSSALHRDIVKGIAYCRASCAWFSLCGGGSPANKLFEAGTPLATETNFCRLTRQALLGVVMTSLEEEATI